MDLSSGGNCIESLVEIKVERLLSASSVKRNKLIFLLLSISYIYLTLPFSPTFVNSLQVFHDGFL